jgi:hypothetical protein
MGVVGGLMKCCWNSLSAAKPQLIIAYRAKPRTEKRKDSADRFYSDLPGFRIRRRLDEAKVLSAAEILRGNRFAPLSRITQPLRHPRSASRRAKPRSSLRLTGAIRLVLTAINTTTRTVVRRHRFAESLFARLSSG